MEHHMSKFEVGDRVRIALSDGGVPIMYYTSRALGQSATVIEREAEDGDLVVKVDGLAPDGWGPHNDQQYAKAADLTLITAPADTPIPNPATRGEAYLAAVNFLPDGAPTADIVALAEWLLGAVYLSSASLDSTDDVSEDVPDTAAEYVDTSVEFVANDVDGDEYRAHKVVGAAGRIFFATRYSGAIVTTDAARQFAAYLTALADRLDG
jgi:hypothetical protein